MVESMALRVLSVSRTLLDAEEVAWVQVRLADGGSIGIWPGHAPLLAETVAAPVRYADSKGEHTIEVDAGLLLVEKRGVTVLAEAYIPGIEVVEHVDDSQLEHLAWMLRAGSATAPVSLGDGDVEG